MYRTRNCKVWNAAPQWTLQMTPVTLKFASHWLSQLIPPITTYLLILSFNVYCSYKPPVLWAGQAVGENGWCVCAHSGAGVGASRTSSFLLYHSTLLLGDRFLLAHQCSGNLAGLQTQYSASTIPTLHSSSTFMLCWFMLVQQYSYPLSYLPRLETHHFEWPHQHVQFPADSFLSNTLYIAPTISWGSPAGTPFPTLVHSTLSISSDLASATLLVLLISATNSKNRTINMAWEDCSEICKPPTCVLRKHFAFSMLRIEILLGRGLMKQLISYLGR